MKHILIILLALLPLQVLAQGELYKRYASRQDLTVAQVSGFRLNDSVRVDVVLLQANDAPSWHRLAAELGLDTQAGGVTSWLAPQDNPALRARWQQGKRMLRVVASHARRTVGFYLIETEQQYDALLDYQLSAMEQPSKNKKKTLAPAQ